MEWMLQVVDEIDDAIGALRLCCVGLRAEIGLLLAGSLGIAAICAPSRRRPGDVDLLRRHRARASLPP